MALNCTKEDERETYTSHEMTETLTNGGEVTTFCRNATIFTCVGGLW